MDMPAEISGFRKTVLGGYMQRCHICARIVASLRIRAGEFANGCGGFNMASKLPILLGERDHRAVVDALDVVIKKELKMLRIFSTMIIGAALMAFGVEPSFGQSRAVLDAAKKEG